jgi:hypothetical protein
VQGQAGSLPLLQYTLNLLWEEEGKEDGLADRTLNTKAYRELGGVRGALQKRADEIYASFSDSSETRSQQAIVRQIFLRLVDIAGLRATGLETFIDVLSLRPGDIWNPQIFSAIDQSDLFVVIWSKNARDSKWVIRESRYALKRYKQHGSPDFCPIPVEGPPIASVPRGLQARHFNDELLGQIRIAELERRHRERRP